MNIEKNILDNLLYKPIPQNIPSVVGWKEIPVHENNEPLVPLGICSDYINIFTNSIYFGERNDSPYKDEQSLEGSLMTCFVRQGVAEQIQAGQKLLPVNYHFVIYDTYRPLPVQQSLFNKFHNDLVRLHPDWSDELLLAETQKYVSLPSSNPDRPSPHNTGGAVDLAIIKVPKEVNIRIRELDVSLQTSDLGSLQRYQLHMRRNQLIAKYANLLDFGTPFDHGGVEASLNYFELESNNRTLSPDEQKARINRRLLFNIMKSVGFEPYGDEWWHFNAKKSQMGTKTANLQYAEYGPKSLSLENRRHELMRRKYSKRISRINSGQVISRATTHKVNKAVTVFESVAKESEDIHKVSLPKAAIISPSE